MGQTNLTETEKQVRETVESKVLETESGLRGLIDSTILPRVKAVEDTLRPKVVSATVGPLQPRNAGATPAQHVATGPGVALAGHAAAAGQYTVAGPPIAMRGNAPGNNYSVAHQQHLGQRRPT